MKCKVCGKEAEFKIRSYNLAICRSCFLNRLFKRIGETIGRYRMFVKDETVYVPSGGYNGWETYEILREMGYRVEIVGEDEEIHPGGILALGNLLEDEVVNVLRSILSWEFKDELLPVYQKDKKKVVKPFCLIIEEEMDIFREIKGIEKRPREEDFAKRKIRERKLLSTGFWLSFYKSFLKEHALLLGE